ncbi:conserved hypothetical protein [uncultured Paludibacter sp.]|nr:conserved hypothetical protein [uncultured Paludibacter sp.]
MAEASNTNNNNFQQFFADAKEYVKLQTDYLRIQSVEKLTILISTLLIIIVAVVLLAGALFYLFFTLAYALAPVVGGLAVSFGIITLFYLIIAILLLVFRNKWIVNPILNLLMKLFYEKSEEKEIANKDGNSD